MVTVRKYAQVVNPQKNPNLTKRENWHDMSNALGHTDLLANSQYTTKINTIKKDGKTKKTYTSNYPYKVNANKFGFNIPSDAYIKKITVGVRMKADKKTDVEYPSCGFYIKDKKSAVHDKAKNKTGYHDGIYWAYSDTKFSKSLYTEEYVMNESNYKKGGFTIENLNSDYFGVDLNFAVEPDVFKENIDFTVFLKWVWVEIEYDLPKPVLYHNYPTNSEDNPLPMYTGASKFVTYTFENRSKANAGVINFNVDIPWGTELIGAIPSNSTYNNGVWTVNGKGNAIATLELELMDYTVNNEYVRVSSDNPALYKDFWYKSTRGWSDGYSEFDLKYASETPPHKRHTSCFAVTSHNVSEDDESIFIISNSEDWDFVSIQLDDGYTSDGVSIKSFSASRHPLNPDGSRQIPENVQLQLVLTVPSDNVPFDVGFTICGRPKVTGENTLTVFNYDTSIHPLDYTYYVADPYIYHIGTTENDTDTVLNERLVNERINFVNHRIASNLETGAFVLPCSSKDGDASMITDACAINMYLWDEIDYIGCVPLEHLHFDPKSTYKDSLLDNHYKNVRYMGKQLASDETITLNVRLHPHQVTTIQGLVDMDKPVPINANHRCFESDPLNHRGWAELYGITSEKTNPHWYKCELDVKYLTHNLDTRFHIKKGSKTFDTTIPPILSEIIGTGESISDNQETDYFIIDTDGTYAYIDDESDYETYYDYEGNSITWTGESSSYDVYIMDDEDTESSKKVECETGGDLLALLEELGEMVETPVLNQPIKVYVEYTIDDELKNRFTLDEGQHLSIKSRNPLSTSNEITFNWLSSKLSENKENNISRVIRLVDSGTDDVVFEYEYCDFDFSNENIYTDIITDEVVGSLNCRIIGRKKNQEDYDTVIDDIITLVYDVESADTSDTGYFGSKSIFRLNDNILSVTEEGFNGKELSRDNIILEGNQYYYESYWVNKNTDAENTDIISYIDVTVQDSILETAYADKYSSLYISPFPVQGKKIIFTRKAEEGVIYYLADDTEEFTYLIEPYYQYHNGVDIRTSEGTSIFNLNYGYRTIYLENGLVSLGINRLNGKMYLRRYDDTTKSYQTLFYLHLDKYDDININSISDDRIELQASDSTIIMYRGHPYVIFKHELEDIFLDSKFYKVYGQSVDKVTSEYPAIYDLMNYDNLLPECVTSKLDDDCVSLSEHDIEDLESSSVELSEITDTVYEGDTVTFNVTTTPVGGRVHFLIKKDDEDGFDEVGHTETGSFDWKFDRSGAYQVIAVYTGDDTYEYSISNEIAFSVGAILTPEEQEEHQDDPESELSGDYVLTMNTPSTFEYRDNQPVVFTLTKGGVPINGKVIQMVDFKHINSATTDDKGQASFTNHRVDTYPDKYKIGARYYEGSRIVTKVFDDVKVKKATPEFEVNHGAESKGGSFSVKLKCGSRNLAKKKITITVNGKKYERTTNDNGNEAIKITKKDTYKYKCVFNGDKGYKKCSITFREKVDR